MTILETILAEKKLEVERLTASNDVSFPFIHTRPSLFNTLYGGDHLRVIAEMKRASPSKGLIQEGANPVEQALAYFNAGAACISVLTDQTFFKGSFDDLNAVANVVPIPLLCKDFIIHPLQIDQARQAGASVILLIVAALNDETLAELYAYAMASGVEVLVEVHDRFELERALALDARLIGVNNRNLRTFEVDMKRTEEIGAIFPFHEKRVLISESGITNSKDAKRAAKAGASAILVGELLMKSVDVADSMRSLQVDLTGVSR